MAFLLLGGVACAMPVLAGQYQLGFDQVNTVAVAADVQNGETICNLVITIQGQGAIEQVVKAPYFEARVDILPVDLEPVSVTWQGKFKRTSEGPVNACPTYGQAQFNVVPDNARLRARWRSLLAQMGPTQGECLQMALQSDGVRYEWFDLYDKQVSPHDGRIQRAKTQCEAFVAQKKAWGDQNPEGFPCTLAGGVSSQCEGYYFAQNKGKKTTITRVEAIQRQLDQQAWGTAVRESAVGRVARQKQAQALQVKKAEETAAKIKAEQEARERAEQRVKAAMEAEIRERNAKIDAELARKIQEIRKKEQERLDNRSWLLIQLEKLRDGSPPAPEDIANSDKAKPPEVKPDAAKPSEGNATPPAAVQPQPAQAEPKAVTPTEPKPLDARPDTVKPQSEQAKGGPLPPA